jgi:sulfur relay (sulfurtransferase) complex TusBCD TusD component (DsrE family)
MRFGMAIILLRRVMRPRSFSIGKGVEAESLDTDTFVVTQQMKDLVKAGGQIFACGTCLTVQNSGPTDVCPLAGLKDLHAIIKESDKVVTF